MLDSQSWSYPGWEEEDVDMAEKLNVEYSGQADFDFILQAVMNRQQIHLHGRTHSDLVRIDELKPMLSNPDWEAGFEAADKRHLTDPPVQ
jgi:hypothetical protein